MSSSLLQARYSAANPSAADGWRLERLTAPSRLFGANGLRTGPDGRVYIAQVTGSQISALDPGTGRLDTVSAKGGDIIAPDDVAFDPRGNLYATEVMDGRVSVREPGGRTRVLRDDLPCANGITVHASRLFIGECREGGRLMELDLGGGAPRILAENLPSPNAMEVGPDGLLYFPLMTANEIWRIDPEGGEPQRVAGDLGVPDAVKFDAEGFIVSTQVASGQVLRIDPRNGSATVLAQLNPGLDNLTFVGDRLFVSNFTGEITEILPGGDTATVLPGGLNWPLDLAVGDDGNLYVADGTYFYTVRPDGSLSTVGNAVLAGLSGLPAWSGGERPGRVRGDDVRRPGHPVRARRRRKRGPRRRIRPALRCGRLGCRIGGCRRRGARHGPRAIGWTGQSIGHSRRARLRLAGSGRGGDRTRRRAPGRGVGCRPGRAAVRVERGHRDRRAAAAAGHPGRRRRALHRRRRRQGSDRARPGHQGASHDRFRVAGRTCAGGGTQTAQGNAAVFRTAGTVRGHHRGTRRNTLRFGRR